MRHVSKSLLIAAALLAGCAHAPAPRPATPVAPVSFTSTGLVATAGWLERFQDPALAALVECARAGSPDLAIVRARQREADAARETLKNIAEAEGETVRVKLQG